MKKGKIYLAVLMTITLTLTSLQLTNFQVRAVDKEGLIASFTFDDTETGFAGGGAKAVASGSNVLSNDARNGKSLSLSGSSNFLTVTKEDGTSLLTGLDNITVCFDSKVSNTSTDWLFYAAPNTTTQTYQSEKYIGIMENTTTVTAERFNSNSIARPTSPYGTFTSGVWKKVIVVYKALETILYIDGKKISTQSSIVDLSNLLGSSSIFYIGKANWETGEFCTALIDNYEVYNYAMTDEEIAGSVTPTTPPTATPTTKPTTKPTTSPTTKPTTSPTIKPTTSPTIKPTTSPTIAPTAVPTIVPSAVPTSSPTPTLEPIKKAVQIVLSTSSLNLIKGNQSAVKVASFLPEDAADKKVTWSSDNSSVASVSPNGDVIAKKAGIATITCTAADGSGITATCSVSVTQPTKTTMKVAWKKVDNALEYQVQLYKGTKSIAKKNVKGTMYTFKNLTAGTTYRIVIKPLNSKKVAGNTISLIQTATMPSVTKLSLKAASQKALLSWKKVSGASGYEIVMSLKKTSGFRVVKAVTSAKTVSYKKASLVKGKKYYFKIRAYKVVKEQKVYGDYSKAVLVKVK